MRKIPEPYCPYCKSDLLRVGVWEVRKNVMSWTKWQRSDGDWIIDGERESDGIPDHMECGHCKATLPDDVAQLMTDMI